MVFIIFSSLCYSQIPSQLFQQALLKENGEGDLKSAVAIYKNIVGDETADRSLRANAQLHIGICYEKLGLQKAQMAYQKVVDNYPEQTEAVKIANEKLSLLLGAKTVIRKEDKDFNIRKVWAVLDVRIGNMSSPSPDGRYISYTDRNGGDLALLELGAKKKHRFTNNRSFIESLKKRTLTEKETKSLVSSMKFASKSTWSPDGRQIAYGWCSVTDSSESEIRLIGIDGSEPRVLSSNDDFEFTVPFDWSPDGKQIIAFIGKYDLTGQAVLVSVADGSVRILKNYDRPYMQVQAKVLFSPDGRYIVYDFVQKEGFTERDIFLLSTDGNCEIKLVEHPADDFVLGWAPDGKRLLFASDRTGEISVWIIQVANGKPQGDAELIKKDIGQIYPLGFTRGGSFYYGLQAGMEDVYTATLDLEKSELLTSPEKANQRLVGSTFFPDWSPDGKYLTYKSGEKLYIQSIGTGMVRELTPDLKSFGSLRWSPDSHSILTTGVDYKDRNGLFEVDTKTGDITSIVRLVPDSDVSWATWSPDGKKLFYKSRSWTEDVDDRIVMYDPVTKQEKELPCGDSDFIALSPDGRSLAFLTQDQQTLSSSLSLNIMPAAGGELREVLKFKKEELIKTVAWAPDGSRLLFAKGIGNGKKCELWQISIEGGKPQKLGLAMENLNFLSVHPDGRRIAFCSSHYSAEIWVMENFLPE